MEQLIRWFRETSLQDVPLVGGKNASLGELCRELVEQGIDSISLNPDAVMKTTVRILETEQALAPSRRSA